MLEVFLIVLAFVWIIFAVVSDLRTREIPNWLNFSLIIFALGARLFYSVFNEDWSFFVQGVVWTVIFFGIANLLYFSRFFAGGDAKLMMALGPIIPLGTDFLSNLSLSLDFLLIFLVVRTVYDLASISYFTFRDSKKINKEFFKILSKNKKIIYFPVIAGAILILLGTLDMLLLIPGLLIILMPYLYIYTKSIENVSLIKIIKTSELTEGDWLYRDVRIGKKTITANWDGLTKNEINLIKKKHKFIGIKRGIQFGPGFLIIFLIFIGFYFSGIDLWNSLW
ncbi:MAG: A24 family peptidase [Candidatus Pacearchaeota archaeon]